MNAPESVEISTELLAAYLTENATTDRQKARAIYRWIAENIEYDVKGLFKGNRVDATAEGALKSRSSVCGGYSLLFEKLANLSGLEAVTISGYSKGYGYSPGMHFTEPANHAWNAVKIEGKWHLIDSTWGAGKVDKDGKNNKEFDDYYFLTSPEKFIFDHLPEDPYWQLLDEPISKEEFEDLVCLEPAFFDLGIRLGNQENASIISNGAANITLYSPEDVSFIAELEMPAEHAFSRRIHGSPTFISRSGEQCLIDLLPPFPGKYTLRVFGRLDSGGKDGIEMIMEYQVIELSGSKRSFPIVSDQFFDLGFKLDDRINGSIVTRGETNLTLDVPADVLMIASLEDAVQDRPASTNYKNSIFVQRMENKYEISLSPPEPGEYILNIFAKRKSDSDEMYPFVMAFNVSVLSGSKRSFPIVSDQFFDLGFKLDDRINGSIVTRGETNLTLDVPADVLMIASLEDAVQDGPASTDYKNSIFVQRMENKYEISLSPPEPGEYILNIFAKRKSDSDEMYPFVMAFNVSVLSGSKRSFPEVFGDFQQLNAYLLAPLTGEIEAGSNLTFQIRIPEAMEVVVVCGDRWNYLTGNGNIFKGNAIIEKGDVDVAVKRPGMRGFRTILRYRAI
ncbi:MAG: transglutaminase domain-containing protein [Methanothrix soehngenii]|nr:transglutaminase domain-containing protein [Methanothrix soehngenii]